MRSKKSLDGLRYVIFDGVLPKIESINLYECAFDLWLREWTETFKELGEKREFRSDDFLSREVGCLFHGDKAIGLCLYQWFDLTLMPHRKHSYFKTYPDGLIDQYLSLDLQRVMAASYMTLDKSWRKSQTLIPVSEVIVGLAVRRFLDSGASAMICYLRNNRGANEIFYRHGGIPIRRNSRAHNDDVDYAYLTPKSARESTTAGVSATVNSLWLDWKYSVYRKKMAG